MTKQKKKAEESEIEQAKREVRRMRERSRYYRRRRPMPTFEQQWTDRDEDGWFEPIFGETVPAMTTRFYSYVAGKRRPYCNVYYYDGRFWENGNVPREVHESGEQRGYVNAFVPFSGTARNRFAQQTMEDYEMGNVAPAMTITVEDGRIVAATGEDGTIWVTGDESTDYLEEALDLKPRTKRKCEIPVY